MTVVETQSLHPLTLNLLKDGKDGRDRPRLPFQRRKGIIQISNFLRGIQSWQNGSSALIPGLSPLFLA